MSVIYNYEDCVANALFGKRVSKAMRACFGEKVFQHPTRGGNKFFHEFLMEKVCEEIKELDKEDDKFVEFFV